MTVALHSPDRVTAFYGHEIPDARGRWLRQTWRWDDETLEFDHLYIQWMFPTDEPSGVNPDAPLVTAASVAAFRDREPLRLDLARSFDRMIAFYGFEWARQEATSLAPAPTFPDRRRVWLTPGNHNHLRLTRMLKCLRLLSQPALGVALFDALESVYAIHSASVTHMTYEYWASAGEQCRLAAARIDGG